MVRFISSKNKQSENSDKGHIALAVVTPTVSVTEAPLSQ